MESRLKLAENSKLEINNANEPEYLRSVIFLYWSFSRTFPPLPPRPKKKLTMPMKMKSKLKTTVRVFHLSRICMHKHFVREVNSKNTENNNIIMYDTMVITSPRPVH